MGFANIIGQAEVSDALMPDDVIGQVIQAAPVSSLVLSRARRVPLVTRYAKQPILGELPEAYWVDGDTGLKQTTDAKWAPATITAEELAVIVPIPDAVIDDAGIPLWEIVRPLLAEAIGKRVDEAAVFGVGKPASWPAGIVPSAIAAGNVVALDDMPLPDAFIQLAQHIAADGFAVNGFAARPGLSWYLRGLKDDHGQYLFGSPAEGGPMPLFGHSLDEVRNGAWQAVEGLAVDWDNFIVGVRQDITYDLFSEGVISDADGKVVLNLMQQDTKALRVVMRVGFAHAIPTTRLSTAAFPAGVITKAA